MQDAVQVEAGYDPLLKTTWAWVMCFFKYVKLGVYNIFKRMVNFMVQPDEPARTTMIDPKGLLDGPKT